MTTTKQRQLMRLLHGELPADEARRLEAELAGDGELKAAYEAMARAWDGLELPTADVPAGFSAGVTAAARKLRDGELSWALAPAWARGGAAAALAAGLALGAVFGSGLSAPATAGETALVADADAGTTPLSLAEVYWLSLDESDGELIENAAGGRAVKRWWLVIALLLSVGVNIGILATLAFQGRTADPAGTNPPESPDAPPDDPRPRDGGPPQIIQRMADELGLEGEKRQAFLESQRAFFEQTLAARSRMARLQRAIRAQVTAEAPDREALESLLGELSAAHTDLERAFVYNLLDARELLDGEQERRYMHFLHRMRHVRQDVEQRFRERWERGRPGFDRPGPGGPTGMGRDRPRGRRGPGRRFEPPPESPPPSPPS